MSTSNRTYENAHVTALRVTSLLAASAISCGRGRPAYPKAPPYGPAPRVSVFTPGVVLTADDGAFTLDESGGPAPLDLGSGCSRPGTEDVDFFVLAGAARVTVTLSPELATSADGEATLYGLLAVCGVPPGSSGPATREYGIQVPANRVEQTSGGRVSVVYEEFAGGASPDVAWVLFLSRRPFPTVSEAANRSF